MQRMKSEADDANKKRLSMLERVIAEHILVPPKFARYPEVEEVLWRSVQSAIIGELTIDDALHNMMVQISEIVRLDDKAQIRASNRNGSGRKGMPRVAF